MQAASVIFLKITRREGRSSFPLCWRNLTWWAYVNFHQPYTCPFHLEDVVCRTSLNNSFLCPGVPEHTTCLRLEAAMTEVPATHDKLPEFMEWVESQDSHNFSPSLTETSQKSTKKKKKDWSDLYLKHRHIPYKQFKCQYFRGFCLRVIISLMNKTQLHLQRKVVFVDTSLQGSK